MKKALQDIKQQVKTMMHQSESLKEMKALLRLSDEIDNVLQILPEGNQAGASKPTAGKAKTTSRSAAASKTSGASQALSGAAPATSKSPAASPAGKAASAPVGKGKKKTAFIDPGDIDPADR